jgi:hypothetical protein
MKIEIMQTNPIMKTLWVKLLGASLGLVVFMKAGAATYYVDTANRHPVSPFTSWATAATNIQDAINAAGFTSNTIWVNDGVYKFGGIYSPAYARVATLGKPLTIQSVNGPEVTIIQGQSGWACARLTDGTVLSGFTLKNSTNYFVGFSGGVFCSSINCLNLVNATNVLELDNISTNNAGSYKVVVTNAAGTVTSAVATLYLLVNGALTPPQIWLLNHDPVNGDGMMLALQAGRNYRVQSSTDLVQWLDVTNFLSQSSLVVFTNTQFSNLPSQYYRVVTP